MPPERSAELFEFARVKGRSVVASCDGAWLSNDACALLLDTTDCILGLTRRLVCCFKDSRDSANVEHKAETVVTQRVAGITLGLRGP